MLIVHQSGKYYNLVGEYFWHEQIIWQNDYTRTDVALIKTKKVANITTFLAFPGMDERMVNFPTFLAIIAR